MKVILAALIFLPFITSAQQPQNLFTAPQYLMASGPYQPVSLFNSKRKLYQRNTGVIIGLQRGKYTSLEVGGEAHWRKISLLKPHIIGATANLSYNPGRNVLGYHAGVWMKRGHINLTYGADINYFTDFNERQAFAIGPSVGFRFFGFDLVNGFNIITLTHKSKTVDAPLPVNTLYISLRYFLPVKNEFTWDRQTMRKKRARKKARLKRIEARKKSNQNNSGDKKKKWNIKLPFSKKQ
ncbi:MAG: hypothetical protein ACTHK8_08055 [Ginsengibacter sp.]